MSFSFPSFKVMQFKTHKESDFEELGRFVAVIYLWGVIGIKVVIYPV